MCFYALCSSSLHIVGALNKVWNEWVQTYELASLFKFPYKIEWVANTVFENLHIP